MGSYGCFQALSVADNPLPYIFIVINERRKQLIPLIVDVENVTLMHECCPIHFGLGTTEMNSVVEPLINKTEDT